MSKNQRARLVERPRREFPMPVERSVVNRADDEPTVSQEEIAMEAYNLYCARGDQDGDDLGDWLAAEQIVRRRHRLGTDRA